MIKAFGVKGLIRKLKKQHTIMQKRAAQGLKKSGLYLQRESQKIVPVDKGVLHNTAFTRQIKGGENPEVAVGYTAAYALYVHEDMEALHGADFNQAHAKEIAAGTQHNRGAKQQAKFLEKPFREKRKQMQDIFKREVKP